MKLQNYIADETRDKAEEVFRYAAAVPADKIEWSPGEGSRTVIDLCREMAKCPDWAFDLIAPNLPERSSEDQVMAESRAEMAGWSTVEECRAACFEKLGRLIDMYREIPDERLKETKWLPYNGGRDHTVLEMLDYPRWNFNYHCGQIAYIQMLYGDKNMY
jgi:hypothetical protein